MTHVVDGGYGISYVVADKGYDAEYVHREVSERLGARAFIPPRSSASPARAGSTRVRTSGFHRGLMRSELDLGVYARRALVETVNSMVKRKMGDTAHGRTEASRCKGIVLRCVAHNLRRIMDLRHKL